MSRKRVIRLMQEEGLKARARKRFKCTTMSDHDQPVAANLLDRQFTAEAPNQRWVGDTTEFVIGESGKLYLAAILDLFSRFVVGWARQRRQRPASDDQGARDGAEAPLSRRPGCCTTPTRAARTRARTTSGARRARHHLQHESARQLLRQRRDGELLLDGEERARAIASTATGRRRWSCSTTSRCSITSDVGTRRSVRSVRPRSSDARRRRVWTLPSLWTHRTRPQGLGNLAQNARFPQRPHPFFLYKRRTTEQTLTDSPSLSTESDQAQERSCGRHNCDPKSSAHVGVPPFAGLWRECVESARQRQSIGAIAARIGTEHRLLQKACKFPPRSCVYTVRSSRTSHC